MIYILLLLNSILKIVLSMQNNLYYINIYITLWCASLLLSIKVLLYGSLSLMAGLTISLSIGTCSCIRRCIRLCRSSYLKCIASIGSRKLFPTPAGEPHSKWKLPQCYQGHWWWNTICMHHYLSDWITKVIYPHW